MRVGTRDPATGRLDLTEVRRRLAAAEGPAYWRCLEEVARTDEFLDYLRHEFPEQADLWTDGTSRRDFLRVMGASFALAGLAGCARQPVEHIVPYVEQPERMIPGQSLFFATAWPFRGYGVGVLAESAMGRPIKIEGNPDHPSSRGATDAMAQASVLSLWDPDRSRTVRHGDLVGTRSDVVETLRAALRGDGEGVRLLTGPVTSPSLRERIERLLEDRPRARWHSWEPANRDGASEGARIAFGEALETGYRFDRAEVVVALDADFLSGQPGSVRYAMDFAEKRRVRSGAPAEMNRLYAVESMPSLTGAMADHRLPVQARRVETLARALASRFGIGGDDADAGMSSAERAWIDVVARDLRAHGAASVVLAGDGQPPVVHALTHAIHDVLGCSGGPVVHTEPIAFIPESGGLDSLRELASAMEAGAVRTLIVLGVNPAYSAPADLEFAERMDHVPLRVHVGPYFDETARRCHWHVPEAHYLESWGDVRAHDGTVTIQQPLIAPLHGGVTALELLGALTGDPGATAHDLVRDHWGRRRPSSGSDREWNAWIRHGTVPDTAAPPRAARPTAWRQWLRPRSGSPEGLELVIRPDPTTWDGRFANNGWLQELPKPLTKLTWDNAAILAPRAAERRSIANGDVVELTCRGRTLRAAAWIQPGHADESVTLHLGYGRTAAGRVGTGCGFDATRLWTSESPWFDGDLALARTGDRYPLAVTHSHQTMEGRDLVREATLEAYRDDPGFVRREGEPPPDGLTLYPGYDYEGGYRWGMSIDLNTCIGCNACVVACQAENNGPIVGKDQVARNREMHWIRIDRYFVGDLDAPSTVHQPVPCMHCENAPCELVCPVGATVHSPEGLNEMIYNRCVGTRYCSNNCPYKVRRFNFLLYTDRTDTETDLHWNPDVTVRGRGVMEKCSYCVQRIQEARITAEKDSRPIEDGEIVTACEQACPTRAIVFGDMNDADSRVSRAKAEPSDYGLLTGLNTRPRTTYLGKIRNPNPELEREDESA